jgi:hypothetical protein
LRTGEQQPARSFGDARSLLPPAGCQVSAEESAATRIQSAQRGHSLRRGRSRQQTAATSIQAAFRGRSEIRLLGVVLDEFTTISQTALGWSKVHVGTWPRAVPCGWLIASLYLRVDALQSRTQSGGEARAAEKAAHGPRQPRHPPQAQAAVAAATAEELQAGTKGEAGQGVRMP